MMTICQKWWSLQLHVCLCSFYLSMFVLFSNYITLIYPGDIYSKVCHVSIRLSSPHPSQLFALSSKIKLIFHFQYILASLDLRFSASFAHSGSFEVGLLLFSSGSKTGIIRKKISVLFYLPGSLYQLHHKCILGECQGANYQKKKYSENLFLQNYIYNWSAKTCFTLSVKD